MAKCLFDLAEDDVLVRAPLFFGDRDIGQGLRSNARIGLQLFASVAAMTLFLFFQTTAQKDLIKAVPGLSDNGRVATMLSLHKFSSKSCIIQYNLEWWRPVIQRIEKLFDDECQQSGIVCCAFSKNSKSNDKHRTLKLTDCLTKTVDCVCKCLRFLRHLLLRSYNKDVVSSKSVDYLNSFLRSVDDRLADEALLTLENLVQEQPARVDINYGEREMVETAAHNNPELQKSLCQIIQGWSFGTMKNALLGCKIMVLS